MSIRQNFLKEQQELEKLFNNGKSLLSKEGFAKDKIWCKLKSCRQ